MHYVPGPPLSEFVSLFWYEQGYDPPSMKERVLPTGAVDLIIRLDRRRTSDSGMSGPRTRSVVIQMTKQHELLGVHFKPGGAFPFLRFPMGDLHNGSISLGDLWGEPGANQLLCLLHDAAAVEAKFRILEGWLLRLATHPLKQHPAVAFAVRQFCSGPVSSSADVADSVGYSQRRFIEIFRNETGMTPKRFHRLRRFRNVIAAVQGQMAVDWVDVALSTGYFDQAHLIHDFREFSAITPAQYLELRTPHINHVRLRN